MQTATFMRGELFKGITMTKTDDVGDVIFLGAKGRGCRYEKIQLGRRNPAIVAGRTLREAHPALITVNKGTANEKSFYVLERSKADDKMLVYVNTLSNFDGGRGFWEVAAGNPFEISRGYVRDEHGSLWDEGLFVMREGDILKVTTTDSFEWGLYLLDGELGCINWNRLVSMAGISEEQPVKEPEARQGPSKRKLEKKARKEAERAAAKENLAKATETPASTPEPVKQPELSDEEKWLQAELAKEQAELEAKGAKLMAGAQALMDGAAKLMEQALPS